MVTCGLRDLCNVPPRAGLPGSPLTIGSLAQLFDAKEDRSVAPKTQEKEIPMLPILLLFIFLSDWTGGSTMYLGLIV
jgi:hypothetical protein